MWNVQNFVTDIFSQQQIKNQYWLKSITHDKTLKQDRGVYLWSTSADHS